MKRYVSQFSALSREIHFRLFDPFPTNVHFAVTNRCNLSCVFCGQDKGAWKQEEEITIQEYRHIIDQLSDIGDRTLSFSGGEIFLHKGILDVFEYCSFKKQKIGSILTNGVLVTEEVARTLVSTGVGHVGFSVDGTREIHDVLRGMKGSLDRVIEAMRQIAHFKRDFHSRTPAIGINYVITPLNVDVIDSVIDLFADLDISSVRFQFLTYISEESLHRHEEKLRLLSLDTPRSYWQGFRQDYAHIDGEALLEKIEKVRKTAMKRGVTVHLSHALGKKDIEKWYGSSQPLMKHCVFPYQSFFILPNGDVPLCDFIRYPVGNVRDRCLLEIWNDERWRNFRRDILHRLLPGCERCCQLS